ncbi:MAG: serine/threonine-protein kinase, partial [Gemmatimonadales bacterium]
MADPLDRLKAALADRYAVQRELGRGGMATVFLALDLKHDRNVAIKVMGHDAAQQMGAERFDREIKTAAKLSHPGILQLFDSGEANGILYYVMPYIQEGSLAERLEREGQLPIDDALDIACEVAEALHHAHQKDIIHRDIKPENILFLSGRPVLADFGIARAMDPSGQQLTQTGMVVGTPAYMSPEQAAGDPNLDGRSDVYALGCVLYEMICGHPPFMGAPREIIARHMTDEVPPLKTARPTVPSNVEETIVRSMAKTPADRFATAHDFAEALAGRKAALAATTSGPALQKLFRGRPLGILVGYLAVTLIAWLGTASLADQFALSPHLPTFVLAVFGLLLPAAGVVAYTLGNGAIRWRAAQTVGVSANAVVAGLALLLLFNGKDLGAATVAVTLTDEEGNTIERVIPKAEFRTRIAIFDFDADPADSSLRWLQYGIPAALSTDLIQDLYIDQRINAHFREDLRERGFQDLTGVPLTLKREIAAEQFRDRFVTGRVAMDGDEILVTMTMYDTRSGRELQETTVRGTDPLALVDELARDVKRTVDV